MKEISDKVHFIKIQNFCAMKDNVKRVKTQATDREKIFAKDISDKELLSKKHKELLKVNNKKTTPWAKDPNRHLTKEDIWISI